MGFPDFAIVGAMKAGTTSLWTYFCYHPYASPAAWLNCNDKAMKEPFYFTGDYNNITFEDYRDFFLPLLGDRADVCLTFEASADYLHTPKVPERIMNANKDVKIIVMLRNPIDRAWSHYWHGVEFLESERLPFDEAIKREIKTEDDWFNYCYLLIGHYAEHLERWHKFVPAENLLAVHSEAFWANPDRGFRAIQEFLGLPIVGLLNYSWERKGTYGYSLNGTRREMLQEYFKPHNDNLYEMLGKDLEWA